MRKRVLLTATAAIAAGLSLMGAARQRAVRVGTPPAPTFSKEVVRIFQQHCQSCHRPGDVAPFPLIRYADAAPMAASIKMMTATRKMPPWKATSGCGEFEGVRQLSAQEIETLARWADAGAPEGNRAELPPPLEFNDGWTLGQPDLVLSNAEAYTPPARGDMYRCFTLPVNSTADRFVSAIDIRPGDRQSVHHVIAFVDNTGQQSQPLDDAEPGPGYQCFGGPGFVNAGTLGGWAPGFRPVRLPAHTGFRLPAGSRVVLQVHYHPHTGNPQPDRTEIGIYYNASQPRQEMRILPLVNTTFTIPPGHPDYEVSASFTIPMFFDSQLWLIAPHMHLLGRNIKVEATTAAGQRSCLIEIADWDFNWQAMYSYRQPVPLRAGTRLQMTARYDNSANNPLNPNNPPKPVSWGEATTDEMAIAFLGFTIDAEDLTRKRSVDTSWIPAMP